MGPKECGLSRYCISECITLVRLVEYDNDDLYPDHFLFLCEKGRITENSPVTLIEETLVVHTEIEHPNAFFGYGASTYNNEQYINQYNTYRLDSNFLSGLTQTNVFDYLWFPQSPRQPATGPVYIDCRYFHYEWSHLSANTQEFLALWFPRLRKKEDV